MNSTTCTDSNSSDEDDMKKLLIASTALSLAGGAAFAEIKFTGDAELGVDYNSEAGEGMSKHSFVHEVGIDFSGSGTTDGGLSFGGSAGFDTNDDTVNEGTVHVSGSFGKLTIGDNDSADLTAGSIADIGLNGIGVDDMVEGLRGGTANQLRYDNSFGQVSIAISAGTSAAEKKVYNPVDYTIPGSGTELSEWYVRDRRTGAVGNRITAFGSMPSLDQFDSAFGLVAVTTARDDASNVSVTHDTDDNPTTADAETNIFGFGYNDDGDLTAADGTTEADEAQEAAYNLYVAVYDLGDDERVGGTTADDADEGERNADSPIAVGEEGSAVTTNEMDDIVLEKDTVLISAENLGKASETEYAFGMKFDAGGVTIGVGYDSNKTVSMGAGFSAGEISTKLLYVKTDHEDSAKEKTGMGVDMSYAMGASTVTLSYGRQKSDADGAMDAVGMGVTHDLGGGATMNAGFGKVADANKASIGIGFKF